MNILTKNTCQICLGSAPPVFPPPLQSGLQDSPKRQNDDDFEDNADEVEDDYNDDIIKYLN